VLLYRTYHRPTRDLQSFPTRRSSDLEHGMPLGELEEEGLHKILVIGADKLFIDRIRELLPEADDFKYELANSGFEAGIQAESSSDRKSTRLNSSHVAISYAVFCLKKK